jgi:hypothetical protein
MWSFSHTVPVPGVTRQQVWAVWSDLPNWPTWDTAAAWVKPDGPGDPMTVGATYLLQPRQGPKARGTMTRVDPGRGFTDRTPLFLCKLGFDHAVEDLPDGRGVRVTHTVTLRGPLACAFVPLLGRRIAAGMPAVMDNLVARAAKMAPADVP